MHVDPGVTKVRSLSRLRVLGVALAVLGAGGCHVTDLPLWRPGDAPAPCEVETIRSISYADGDGGRDNQLDLFVPKGKLDCPVVLLVHGGAWMIGDNRCCGLYSSVGEMLASQGIIAVLPNYRLSPEVKHPAHIKDVARAAAWIQTHIEEHGGRRDQFFLMGHSAGGHLVALLATDEKYLQAHGLAAADIKGVIAVSGVYHIPPGGVDMTFGGPGPNAMRWDKMVPLREPSSPCKHLLPGIPAKLDIFKPVFGKDASVREDASPLAHVRAGLPPFLLIAADNDLPTLPDMAGEFHRALLDKGCDTQLLLVPERNHNSIIFAAFQPCDPVAYATLEFIRSHLPATSEQDENMPATNAYGD